MNNNNTIFSISVQLLIIFALFPNVSFIAHSVVLSGHKNKIIIRAADIKA